jgi:hypothetical protein
MSSKNGNLGDKAISKTLGEAGHMDLNVKSDQTIEIPTSEFGTAISDEAFMNEHVLVEVAETTNENEPPSFVLSVNGITQPVFRGVPTKMRRMFLEVLARCKESKYTQHTLNPNEPDRIELRQRTALAYPFQVLEDPNPKGRAWLRAVLSEAA